MKKFFYLGLTGLAVFEALNVYFIMPFPGSQRMASLDFAYFLHAHRWWFRIGFGLIVAGSARSAFGIRHRWAPALAVLVVAGVAWFANFEMAAESMFKVPRQLSFRSRAENKVDESSLVVAVEHDGEAKAYPMRFLIYHHQVPDVVGGTPVLVTYCSVCRTGRVFAPVVQGRRESFRLVGMDHFNAMFEDATTQSWWRQATGEAVAGPLKGAELPEVASVQMTLQRWFELHPAGVVMQPDDAAKKSYDEKARYERGESKGQLTRRDPGSWEDKSWVVGVEVGKASKAYDWNELRAARLIQDDVDGKPIAIVLAADERSFAAFARPTTERFTREGETLSAGGKMYDLFGRNVIAPTEKLIPVAAYQEYWHSWRTFHPQTSRYQKNGQ